MQPTTIDADEIAYYNQLAERWWDLQGPFWPLHRLNRLRVAYLRTQICRHFARIDCGASPLAGLTVLDIGCGGGILSESMARLGASVHGIDVAERNIVVARQHARQSKLPIDYQFVDVEALVDAGRRYDIVLNMEVVEHVANLPAFMQACTRLVADNGILFVATINRNPLSWLFAIVGAEYLLRWLPIGTHRWRKFVRPGELESLLARDGMSVRDMTGVSVNPLNRRFSLSPRPWVNYMLSAVHRKAGPGN